jgi:hypothetical protein
MTPRAKDVLAFAVASLLVWAVILGYLWLLECRAEDRARRRAEGGPAPSGSVNPHLELR